MTQSKIIGSSFTIFELDNVQALATLPAGASVETGVEVGVTERRRRNSGLVGVAQPRLVRLPVHLCFRSYFSCRPCGLEEQEPLDVEPQKMHLFSPCPCWCFLWGLDEQDP